MVKFTDQTPKLEGFGVYLIVRRTVDRLDLKAIVVYDVCKSNEAVEDIFAYAIEHGIKVHVPMNTLKA